MVQGRAPVVGVSVDAGDGGAQVLWQVCEVAECVTHTKLLKGCNLGLLQAWLLQQSTQHLQRGPRVGPHPVKQSCVQDWNSVTVQARQAAGWV